MFDTGFVAVVFSLWAALAADWSAPFERGPADPGMALSYGQTYKDYVAGSRELRLTYLAPMTIGPAQVIVDGSITDQGGIYAGLGGRMVRDFHRACFSMDVGEIRLVPYDDEGSPLGFHVIERLK